MCFIFIFNGNSYAEVKLFPSSVNFLNTFYSSNPDFSCYEYGVSLIAAQNGYVNEQIKVGSIIELLQCNIFHKIDSVLVLNGFTSYNELKMFSNIANRIFFSLGFNHESDHYTGDYIF